MQQSDEIFQKWQQYEQGRNDKFGQIHVPFKQRSVLRVTVVNGKGIKRTSILNLVDKPNPQIVLEYPDAVGPQKFATTAHKDTVDPEWNESFAFILIDDHETMTHSEIKILLIVEDWHDDHDVIGSVTYNVSKLAVDIEVEETIRFGDRGSVNIKFKKEIRQNPDIRFSHSLCDDEMQFRQKRIPKVMKSMQNLLGEYSGPKDVFETPVMSFVGSGGGFRAMIGMTGVCEALTETGLMDCLTYAFGTSGSGWYLSSAYTRQAIQENNQKDYHNFLKASLHTSIAKRFLSLDGTVKFGEFSKRKKKLRQPVTLVDYYGYCVAEEIVGEEYSCGGIHIRVQSSKKARRRDSQFIHVHSKLSDVREYIASADVPYLVLPAQQVLNEVDTWTYHADLNISPFECEVPQYGINFDIKVFNSEIHCGFVNRKLPEPSLNYIQGVIGSAFSLRLGKIFNLVGDGEESDDDQEFFGNASPDLELFKKKDSSGGLVQMMKQKVTDWFEILPKFMDRSFFIRRTAEILNFARGYTDITRYPMNPFHNATEESQQQYAGLSPSEDVISVVDAGLLINTPCEPALRPQRGSDILFITDFVHAEKEAKELWVLKKSVTLAKQGGLKFPPIDFNKIMSEPLQEFYVFEDLNDPECPIVFYLSPLTERFKKLPTYKTRNKSLDCRGEQFTSFDVIGSKTYKTFNADYNELEFERLKELMWFNVIVNVETIKRKIHQKILQKRSMKQNYY